MIIYVVQKGLEVLSPASTSLKGACKQGGVSYVSAYRGRRTFLVNDEYVRITEVLVEKIKGRGRF